MPLVKPHDAFSQFFAEQRILDMIMMPKSECLGNRSHAQKPACLVHLLEVRQIPKKTFTGEANTEGDTRSPFCLQRHFVLQYIAKSQIRPSVVYPQRQLWTKQ
jgi:hypothetical protein